MFLLNILNIPLCIKYSNIYNHILVDLIIHISINFSNYSRLRQLLKQAGSSKSTANSQISMEGIIESISVIGNNLMLRMTTSSYPERNSYNDR